MGDEEVPWRDAEACDDRVQCSASEDIPCSSKDKGKEKVDDTQRGPIFSLPPELIHQIFSHLSAFELIAVSKTCRALHALADSDHLWHDLVQANVPGVRITSPRPLPTYRALYAAHDPHWFLTKHQIWFSDINLTGRVIIVEYDQRRGCMEGYQLVAVRHAGQPEPWQADPRVIIHDFHPQVGLHLDRPILRLAANTPETLAQEELDHEAIKVINLRERHSDDNFTQQAETASEGEGEGSNTKSFKGETRMSVGSDGSMHSSFMLVRPAPESNSPGYDKYPYGGLWPPTTVPAKERIQGHDPYRLITASDDHHLPQSRKEISEYGFRIKKWFEMRVSLGFMHEQNIFTEVLFHARYPAPIAGMEISTFSTLDPKLYTPTADKPFRGIWVGDYTAHGCEFILVHQPEDDDPFDEAGFARLDDESDEAFEQRKRNAQIYRGEMKAIKLTGDPNVPRGEYTFLVRDLGDHAICQEEPFVGARMVPSQGHVAGHGFEDDQFISSQLLVISPNRLAQYWHDFYHISYFERVDLDQFLKPAPR